MRQLPFLGVLFVLLCLASCRQTDDGHLLHLADEQVQKSVDSVYSLLSKIEEPSRLSEEDKLLYGWLWAYVHYSWNSSMVEDTLVVRAGDQYIARQDTGRMLLSYLLKAKYYHWAKEREHSVALLDTGVEAALALCDTTMAVKMLDLQADEYTYTWKDYRRTVASLKQALALKFSLLALVLVGGGAYLSIRSRRNRLIEAEERIETLKRLLADATKDFGQDTDGEESATEVEDGVFFRKILLQQLGIIRLVATQPTSQNQEMLRRISGITNGQLPVESLLVWEDLYPVIDRVYDHFYTNMIQRFGSLLIDKEQQLCCLLCAEFSTKEISVVTQQSIPTIYQRKTNIRKKLGVGEKEDIVEFILKK